MRLQPERLTGPMYLLYWYRTNTYPYRMHVCMYVWIVTKAAPNASCDRHRKTTEEEEKRPLLKTLLEFGTAAVRYVWYQHIGQYCLCLCMRLVQLGHRNKPGCSLH
jgi:hypothetical protein